jgi:hypothetical protein
VAGTGVPLCSVTPMTAVPSLHSTNGLVTLPEVQRAAGISREALRIAIDDGLVTPTPVRVGRGRNGGAYTFTKEDALLLAVCAVMALAAGIAFITMLRVLRSCGAQVNPLAGTVTLPLP